MTTWSDTRSDGARAVADAQEITRTALSAHADRVDRDEVFPAESIAALAESGLLCAALPARFGGMGLDTAGLAEVARALGRGCGSSAMIWAMHQVQTACVARHIGDAEALAGILTANAAGGGLIASVTTEAGVGGNLRESRACLTAADGKVTVVKQAPTISYALAADAYLITARRGPDSPPGDQVMVLATKGQTVLEDVGEWHTMGMRGTRSPGCRITACVPAEQVITTPFAEVAERTMVPLSHILWSAVWIGIAEEAARRAGGLLRRRGLAPGAAPDLRLADISERLGLLNGLLRSVTDAYDRMPEEGGFTTDFAIEVNNLKLSASTQTVKVAETALEICGMAGYQEHSALSVARMLRDLYSARLMISNTRLQEANATAMLMRRYG